MTDYYAVLGVSRNCTEDELKSAFRKAALKYHPDTNKDPGAPAQFRMAVEAYDHISSEILRSSRDPGFKARKEPDVSHEFQGFSHEYQEPSPDQNFAQEPHGETERPEMDYEQQMAQEPLIKLLIRLFIPPLRFIDDVSNYVQMDTQYILAVKWGLFIASLQVFLIMIIFLASLFNALNNVIIGLIPVCLLMVILPFAPTILAIWEARNRDLMANKTRFEELLAMIQVGFIAGVIGNAPILLTFWAGTLLGLQIFGFTGLLMITIFYIGVNSIGVPLGYYSK